MPLAPPNTTNAALHAAIDRVPGLEVFHGRTPDGLEWMTVTWPAREIIMQRDAVGGPWQAFDPSRNDATSTGATAPEALRAALANA